MRAEIGEVVLTFTFMITAVGLRIWAHRKFVRVKGRVSDAEFMAAYDALRTASDVAFTFLILSLAWIANSAWSKL